MPRRRQRDPPSRDRRQRRSRQRIRQHRARARQRPSPRNRRRSEARAATAINAFGFDLYARLAKTDGNLVFSPASIQLALAMARLAHAAMTASRWTPPCTAPDGDAMATSINALAAALDSRNGTFKDNRWARRHR